MIYSQMKNSLNTIEMEVKSDNLYRQLLKSIVHIKIVSELKMNSCLL